MDTCTCAPYLRPLAASAGTIRRRRHRHWQRADVPVPPGKVRIPGRNISGGQTLLQPREKSAIVARHLKTTAQVGRVLQVSVQAAQNIRRRDERALLIRRRSAGAATCLATR